MVDKARLDPVTGRGLLGETSLSFSSTEAHHERRVRYGERLALRRGRGKRGEALEGAQIGLVSTPSRINEPAVCGDHPRGGRWYKTDGTHLNSPVNRHGLRPGRHGHAMGVS